MAKLSAQSDDSRPVSHYLFDKVLKEYVDDNGMVDYSSLKANNGQLIEYLNLLENNSPRASWSRNEELAYWINAYNAFTLKLIIDYYPVKSIKDIGSTIQIPFVNTPWDIEFIHIDGKEYSLNNIEHGIIRKKFNEPRIHFALVCAAKSCPELRREAYIPNMLDEQLSDQAKEFLGDSSKNYITESKIKLSKLFQWYGADFTKKMTLSEYLNQYAPIHIPKKAKKTFMDYDWALNQQ